MIEPAHGPAAAASPSSSVAACTLLLLAVAMGGGCGNDPASAGGNDTAAPAAGTTAAAPTRPDTPPVPLPELGIEEVQVGRGEVIGEGSWAVVHSRIISDSGTVLEDTRGTRRPAEMFLPGTYLEGLVQGLMGMQPGGMRKLTIPSHLAYGDDPPARSKVSPGETLHATLECLQVFNEPDIILPSGMKIISDGRGEGLPARYGSWVVCQVLMMAGADERVVYDSSSRGGPIEIGLPAPAGVVVGRRYEPQIPWFDAALYGIRAREFRQVVIPARLAFGGAGNFPLGIEEGEGVGFEITCLNVLDGPRKELASGLIIEDIEIGDGPYVRMGRFATIRESLTLEDGTLIYSNLSELDPVATTMIPRVGPNGWNRGLTGMRAGGERRLTIPPALAYGDKSPRNYPNVPPGATLSFNVRLLELSNRRPPPPSQAPGGN